MAIIVARAGKPAVRLTRTVVQEESYLQRYILDNPDVLPLDQLRDDVHPLVLVREFPTASGPIDAIAVDDRGSIYLIETKLYKNPDKRLVLAQVLDYGAALWKAYDDPDDFLSRLDQMMQDKGDKALSTRLGEAYGLEGQAALDLLSSIKDTVASGRFKFVIVMDTVEDRLKNLIAYVNASSSFDVLGIGLDFYQHEGFDILIPTLHGVEIKKTAPAMSTASARRAWDVDSFFNEAPARVAPEHLSAVRSLYEWCQRTANDITWGTGAKSGSFGPRFDAICSRSLFTVKTDGTLTLNFGWINEPASAKVWRETFGKTLLANGFTLPPGYPTRWIAFPASTWVPRLPDFIRILSECLPSVGAT